MVSCAQVSFFRSTLDDDGTRHSSVYEVVDDTRHFTSAHWKRVVAVFTFGKEWQFKSWNLGDISTMFHRVCGFYLAFKGEALPPTISNWNVTVLWIEKNSRHLDVIAHRTLWEVIDRAAEKHPRLRLK